MRAYLIASDAGPDDGAADAVLLDGGAVSASLRAAGEAIPGESADVADVAPDGAAARAATGGGTSRIFLRIAEIDAPDLDARLAATATLKPDAIVLPARHGRDIAHLGSRLAVHEAEHGLPDGGIGIVAIVSCAAGMLAAASFAGASPRLRGLGWDAGALARQLGGSEGASKVTSPQPPHPEAQPRLAPRDADGGRGAPWGSRPVLAHARATVRLAAAAAGVEAIEAAYPGDDAAGFGAYVAAARRDGFGAMFARHPGQARLIRGEG